MLFLNLFDFLVIVACSNCSFFSDSDGLNFSLAGWNLELSNKVLHKPVRVGASVEVLMILANDVDLDMLRLDLRNVLASDAVWASLVTRGRKEGHGHLVDERDIDKRGFLNAFKPFVSELLEAIGETIHDPVLL